MRRILVYLIFVLSHPCFSFDAELPSDSETLPSASLSLASVVEGQVTDIVYQTTTTFKENGHGSSDASFINVSSMTSPDLCSALSVSLRTKISSLPFLRRPSTIISKLISVEIPTAHDDNPVLAHFYPTPITTVTVEGTVHCYRGKNISLDGLDITYLYLGQNKCLILCQGESLPPITQSFLTDLDEPLSQLDASELNVFIPYFSEDTVSSHQHTVYSHQGKDDVGFIVHDIITHAPIEDDEQPKQAEWLDNFDVTLINRPFIFAVIEDQSHHIYQAGAIQSLSSLIVLHPNFWQYLTTPVMKSWEFLSGTASYFMKGASHEIPFSSAGDTESLSSKRIPLRSQNSI